MDINNVILSDESLKVIQEGAWVGNLYGADEGVRLKVRGMQSDAARAALIAAYSRLRVEGEGKPATQEQRAQVTAEVLAEVCLMDWEGFTSGHKPFPFDAEQAKKWITSQDRKNERFINMVLEAVRRVDNQSNEFVETAAKN